MANVCDQSGPSNWRTSAEVQLGEGWVAPSILAQDTLRRYVAGTGHVFSDHRKTLRYETGNDDDDNNEI